jgi:hypothetical protein
MQLIKANWKREISGEYVLTIKHLFSKYFSSLKYLEHKPERICSGIDPSVRFIGSHISVFKQYLISETIPDSGYYIVQDCLRTRNAKYLFDDNYLPEWASYFPSLGIIVQPNQLNGVVRHIFNFLIAQLNIPHKNIRIRINKKDDDLFDAIDNYTKCENLKMELEYDTKPEAYYRHKFGINNISGRNFNISLRNGKANTFSDIGNVIFIENSGRKIGIEVALGATTTLKQILGLNHVLDCFPILGLSTTNEIITRKLEDAIIVSTRLFREGLKPLGSDNKERLFRTYLRSISYFRNKSNISLNSLSEIIASYESKEFPAQNHNECTNQAIVEYISQYEKSLINKPILSKEDKIIYETLINCT